MQCFNCGFANPEGMKFCGQCGAALGWQCTTCAAPNPASSSLCSVCGALRPALSAAGQTMRDSGTAAEEPVTAEDSAPPGNAVRSKAERRQITVVFCDLVGSTALSAALDPEEFRELLQSYQQAAAAAIERFGGYVAQYLGDGVLAYFGYPVAFDAEAAGAVRAALQIIDRIGELNAARVPGRSKLAVRVGVHSGVVVISEVGRGRRREQLALGEVPNIAARLQGLAAPDTVVLSETTHRLVAGEFHCEKLGTRVIKGLPRPEHVYRVRGEPMAGESARSTNRAAEPSLVGRKRELRLLRERWNRARAGRGQAVVICGDAGIGKSRLVRAFLGRLRRDSFLLLQGRCLPYYQNTAFYAITDLLRRRVNFGPDQSEQERLEALVHMLECDGDAAPDVVPVCSSLLSLSETPPPDSRSSGRRADATRAALLQLFTSFARRQPLILLLEDLHWADPSTLDLVDQLIGEVALLPALVILTHRLEFRPPWAGMPTLTQLPLARLERREVEVIVDRLTGHRRLPAPVLDQIVDRTDGVPLFVEELTKMLLETGLLRLRPDRYELDGPLPPLAIPATLHDSLEARLDRLAATKELAQIGAAIGREFGYDLIRAVSPLDEKRLRQSLEQLVDAELLQQRGAPPHAVYSFKHALIQEAAYESLLKSSRQQQHLRIARVLEARFPEVVATEPERLAQHYAAAGLLENAFGYWLKAGSRAVERSANHEAVAHFGQAQAALHTLPDTPEWAGLQLELQLALGPALVATRGYAAPEVQSVYVAAAELSAQLGDAEASLRAVCGLFSSHLVQMQLDEAIQQAERLLGIARQTGRAAHLLMGSVTMGAALVELGRSSRGREYLEAGLRLYNPDEHFALTFMVGQDFGVVASGYLSNALWQLGLPEQGLARAREALELARRLDHPHTLAFALAFNANLRYLRREPEPLLELAEQLLGLAERAGFLHWLLPAIALGGWARVELGDLEPGLAMLRRIGDPELKGGLRPVYYRRLLVLGLQRAGRSKDALQAIDEVDAPDCDGACTWRTADLFCIRGTLLAQFPERTREAEQWLRRSLQLANDLDSLTLKLRAATRLTRLLAGTARADSVRQTLREVYDAFEEGFDLPDLQDARQVLQQELLAPAAAS